MRISDWSSDVCSSDLVGLAGGQRIGLAAEAADALDAADEAGAEHGLGLRQLVGGRAVGEQLLQLLVDDRLDLLFVDVLLHRRVAEEVAAQLRRPVGVPMLSTSWSSCTRRLSRREVALPPSTC